jgi:hypothetical protein
MHVCTFAHQVEKQVALAETLRRRAEEAELAKASAERDMGDTKFLLEQTQVAHAVYDTCHVP